MEKVVVFVVALWIQITGSVISFQTDSHDLLDNAIGDTEYNIGGDRGDVELFARGLQNENGETFDVRKAISLLGQIGPKAAEKTAAVLGDLANNFGGATLMGQLFAHIWFLVSNPTFVRRFPGTSIPSSNTFDREFTREALLMDIESLPTQTVVNGKKLLTSLIQSYKGTDMGILFSNISELLGLQSTLKYYANLCKNVDRAFGLDQQVDISALGLPIPTAANPEVYFQLVDDNIKNAKFLVRVRKENGQIRETIMVRAEGVNPGDGAGTVTHEEVVPDDVESIRNLYSKLPMSKFIKKE